MPSYHPQVTEADLNYLLMSRFKSSLFFSLSRQTAMAVAPSVQSDMLHQLFIWCLIQLTSQVGINPVSLCHLRPLQEYPIPSAPWAPSAGVFLLCSQTGHFFQTGCRATHPRSVSPISKAQISLRSLWPRVAVGRLHNKSAASCWTLLSAIVWLLLKTSLALFWNWAN